mmetsp:Transcript_32988/g.60426  ORF Transcript_32988/g.60426 Transcript_32988/m.60426 type:complete len:205 (-) Transcript_32988:95-709(-)
MRLSVQVLLATSRRDFCSLLSSLSAMSSFHPRCNSSNSDATRPLPRMSRCFCSNSCFFLMTSPPRKRQSSKACSSTWRLSAARASFKQSAGALIGVWNASSKTFTSSAMSWTGTTLRCTAVVSAGKAFGFACSSATTCCSDMVVAELWTLARVLDPHRFHCGRGHHENCGHRNPRAHLDSSGSGTSHGNLTAPPALRNKPFLNM